MRYPFLLSAVLTGALAGAAPALASDMDLPPEFRTSAFEVYVGAYGSANLLASEYQDNTGPFENSLDGTSYGAGLRAGTDYIHNGWVFGLVGDWTYGTEVAEDEDNGVNLHMSNLFTLRGRTGYSTGSALFYVTGGFAEAEIEFELESASGTNSTTNWNKGWTVGAGIDYRLTNSVALNLEYLYIDLDEMDHAVTGAGGLTESFTQEFEALHTFRLGVNYAFQI